jgi:serine/threonine protein kinase
MIGQQFGNYEIISLLGEGGMAAVYRAKQTNLNRDVAIKVIRPALLTGQTVAQLTARFQQEAQTIGALEHPHILKLFEYGQSGDVLYLVMPLMVGASLADYISRGPIALSETLRYVDQIASALDYAHRKGIIHRDLKPQNILLDEEKNASITDFGLVKILGENNDALTTTGMILGTPAYMAPEQWRHSEHPVDARTDLYALGVMIHEMLSGRQPLEGTTPFQLMHAHIYTPPIPIREHVAKLPSSVEMVILKALAKNPQERFQSGKALADALHIAADGTMPPGVEEVVSPSKNAAPTSKNRLVLVFSAVAAVLTVMAGVLFLNRTTNNSIVQTSESTQANIVANTAVTSPVSTTAVSIAPSATTVSATNTQPSPTNTIDSQGTEAAQRAIASQTALVVNATQTGLAVAAALQSTLDAPTATPTATFTFTPIPPTVIPTSTRTASPSPTITPAPATNTSTAPTRVTNNNWIPQEQDFDGVTMVLVPAGCFTMGSNDEQDERPTHQICFDQPFWLDKFEVTNAQFAKFNGAAAKSGVWEESDVPRENITWFEASAFCEARGARLPTESEWEYAARGPLGLKYPWGDAFIPDNVVYEANSGDQTAPVGSRPKGASWVGALDMSGNVSEWVSSTYQSYPYQARDGRENRDDTTSNRVLRGGSCFVDELLVRASNRLERPPDITESFIGFRCVK